MIPWTGRQLHPADSVLQHFYESKTGLVSRDPAVTMMWLRGQDYTLHTGARMNKTQIGKEVPDLELRATDDQVFRLSDLRGKNIVLYFYPKDNTPGCTTEGQDFRDNYEEFEALNTIVLGVSRDSLKSHESFKSKQCFPFDLVSDTDGQLCDAFGVIKEKHLYGKKIMGIERSTFIIDRKGVLRSEFRKIKVPGHVLSVLDELKNMR
jgi:peroxiredoxin Q/BCP